MALRTFTDRDGVTWNVWNVAPNNSNSYQERFRDGWVCFEQIGGGGRCRMPMSEVPPGWESLPDERLDLIRRMAATSSTSSVSASSRPVEDDRFQMEDDAKVRKSGPHQPIGIDEDR